jgi:hypothetical protein
MAAVLTAPPLDDRWSEAIIDYKDDVRESRPMMPAGSVRYRRESGATERRGRSFGRGLASARKRRQLCAVPEWFSWV